MTYATLKPALKQLWGYLRQVTGDDAYERYLEHHGKAHPDALPMSRRDYFKHLQDEKWNKISRCC